MQPRSVFVARFRGIRPSDTLERKHFLRTDMEFARNCDTIAQRRKLLYHGRYTLLDPRMIAMCTMPHRIHRSEERTSRRPTGWRRRKSLVEYQGFATQFV